MVDELSLTFDKLPRFSNQISGSTSLLLVSHKDGDQYKSVAISLDDLASYLTQVAISAHSMAYCQSSDFATVDHDHDIFTSATYQTKFNSSANVSIIMDMYDSTHSSNYQMSISAMESEMSEDELFAIQQTLQEKSPLLGQLKFIAANDLTTYKSNFTWNNSSFNGWVLANGTKYTTSDFVLSDGISYAFQTAGSTFTVPNLTQILKINDTNDSNSYDTIDGVNHLKTHTHSHDNIDDVIIDTDINQDSIKYDKSSFSLNTTGSNGDGVTPENLIKRKKPFQRAHYGANLQSNQIMTYTNKLDENAFTDSFQLVSEAGTDDISYPSHTTLPVLVYVGKSKYSNIQLYDVVH